MNKSTNTEAALLFIVATPIGNRDDISLRAISVLKEVDVIAAEDTRHSKRLLDYHHIKTPLISLHAHNESQRIHAILKRLSEGERIALISDAGTPLISDPGYRLVAKVQEAGFHVSPIPGACAAIAALSVSGLPTDRFVFEGFLPARHVARKHYLETLKNEFRTIILYESTHRIVESLQDMCEVFGDTRQVTMARELTKSFETVHQDNLPGLLSWVQADPNQQKGEFVIVLQGYVQKRHLPEEAEARRILSILLQEMPLKQAVGIAAQLLNGHRKFLYQLALNLKNAE